MTKKSYCVLFDFDEKLKLVYDFFFVNKIEIEQVFITDDVF
jgi:hypothetical protein